MILSASLFVGFLLFLLCGLIMGLLGGGGSILSVPVLMYVLGFPPKAAMTTSLAIVSSTACVGVVSHIRAGNVDFRRGILFSVVAGAGGYVGGICSNYVSAEILLGLFVGLMLVSGFRMLRTRKRTIDGNTKVLPPWKVIFIGFFVGFLTGMVGVGGGFIIVPALVMMGGFDMPRAIGTSLLVIAINAMAGLAGHLRHETIDLESSLGMAIAAAIGVIAGAHWVAKINPQRLRQLFAVFLLIMAGFIVIKELI